MNGTFHDALKNASATLSAVVGEDVVYRRGTGAACTLRMRPSGAKWQAKTRTVIEEWIGVDWIVTPTEWQRSGLTAPARGDKIIRTVNGTPEYYELVAPDGQQFWDTATYGESYALHTQRVAK